MKYAVLTVLFLAGLARGQEQKHLVVAPLNGARPSILTANDIVRGGEYPATIHLKGAVEIKTPLCLVPAKNKKLVCDGYTLLRADEAIYHEDTGQIEASGAVSVTPGVHEVVKKPF